MVLEMPTQEQYRAIDRRAKHHRERARQAGKEATLTGNAWLKALQYWGCCCCYCGRHADECGPLTIDHYRPLSEPGSPGTVRKNCLPACNACNQAKGDQPPAEWIRATFGPRAPMILARIHIFFGTIQYKVEEK